MLSPGPCTLRLLGRVELRDPEGRIVALRTRKVALLLAILAISGDEWHSRADLAASIWEGADSRAAREGLRTALSMLRKALPPKTIRADGDRLSITAGSVLVPLDDPTTGEFMAGFDNDWIVERRLQLRSRFVSDALAAAEKARTAGRVAEALRHAERACALDPLDGRAAASRTNLLRGVGRIAEAVTLNDAHRARVVRELGVVPELSAPTNLEENPLLAAVEWALARDPEEACELLAATRGQWFALSVERALDIHRRVLAASPRTTRSRSAVESSTTLFSAMIDPQGVRAGEIERSYRAALEAGEWTVASSLCEALAYGSLSLGAFAQAIGYAAEGVRAARARRDATQVGQWEIHLGVVEFHAGDSESCYRHIDGGVSRVEESGSAVALLNAHNAQIGFWTHRGWIDRAAGRLDSQRRRVEAYGSERIVAWTFEMEALLHERMGDLPQARRAYERFRALAPAAGQCAVASAEDGLMRINCGLREFDDAARSLARNVAYRRRKGSVPSAFERATNAPSVRTLRERIGESALASAFRREALSV